MPLRVLITNITLTTRTGTELVVRDLALGLHRAGAVPMVWAPGNGEIAREIAAAGVTVVGDLDSVPCPPDLVHGHHHAQTVEALLKFPEARGIFICHSRRDWHDVPPPFPRIQRFIAVDLNCRERLAGSGAAKEEQIRVILNWADLARFQPRGPLPPRPRRALIFSNYAATGNHLDHIRSACEKAGLPVDIIGSGSGNSFSKPETALPHYDLVFAKAKCAIEAMCTGCAVVLCDTSGLGPLVTRRDVATLAQWNFGARCLSEPLDAAAIASRIAEYDPADAGEVAAYMRAHASLERAMGEYLALYREVLDEPRPAVQNELRAYLDGMAWRCGSLETVQSDAGMPGIGTTTARRISLKASASSVVVRRGETFAVEVEVDNQSLETLRASPPYPMMISYHWLNGFWKRALVDEGLRTPLDPPLAPGRRRSYFARVEAPQRTGKLTLRLTLLQEGRVWFDRAFGRYCDLSVRVEE